MIKATVTEAEGNRYKVTMQATDSIGEILSATITVNSRAEAEKIKQNYESKPDGVYRGILFSATGMLEFQEGNTFDIGAQNLKIFFDKTLTNY